MKDKNLDEIINYYKSGKFIIAEKKLSELMKKFPNNYFLYNLFGAILTGQKKMDEAIIYYEKSIKISPGYADAYNNLAGILADQKKYNKAIEYLQKAIQINPNLAEAFYNLGNAFFSLNKYSESIDNYNRAIKIKPNYAKAYNNLGNVLKKIKRINESIYSYQQSTRIDPNSDDTYYNLGNVFKEAGKLNESINSYNQAVKINHQHVDAYNKLANLYIDIGKINDAYKCFQELIKLKPENIEYKINKALLITPITQSVKEIDSYRKKYMKGLESLKKYKFLISEPTDKIELNFFYLAYHAKENLEIKKKTAKFFKKIIPNVNYVSNDVKKQKIIKVGFISEFFSNHTIAKLFGGLIKNIDRKKFEVVIFHTSGTSKSLMRKEIDDSASKTIILNSKIENQQQQIKQEKLDILFYPDIGMSPTTYFLALSRFAPVQIVSWGHPETTGIDTIDYFLSSALFELNNAKKKYSERLIQLSQFPLYYNPPFVQSKSVLKNRSDFNFPKKKRLYGCVQTLFKLHPEFDSIFAKILHQDIDGNIVLIGGDGKAKFWIESLKKRWSKNFPILNEKVLFTKKLSLLEFISLCNCVDVLLDPFHFGGGNTFLEAMTVGTPFITKRDKHLKTNIASAGYKQMKILNSPVAQNSKEYINLAINLAKDKEKNNLLRKKSIIAAKKYLFNNRKTLIEFEKFLIESLQAAQHGKKLKDGSIFKTK